MVLTYVNNSPMTSGGVVWEKGDTKDIDAVEATRLLETFKGWFTDSTIEQPTEEVIEQPAEEPTEEVIEVAPATTTKKKR